MHPSLDDVGLTFIGHEPLGYGLGCRTVLVGAPLVVDRHDRRGNNDGTIGGVDYLNLGFVHLSLLQDRFLKDHDDLAFAGLKFGQSHRTAFNFHLLIAQGCEVLISIFVLQRTDGVQSCSAGQGVGHTYHAFDALVIGKVVERVWNVGLGKLSGVVGQNHVADANRVPISFLVVVKSQVGSIVDHDRLEDSHLLEFQSIGRIGDHEHVTTELACCELCRNLGLQRTGSTIEKFNVDSWEHLFQGLIDCFDDIVIHRSINH
ncbi:hypothetical protein SDC9_122800 [bioreactor metagenome]|uniref:Uncharacterized protein n=1 Tax=bioreactor metagenome TaxID=1076179 RepID=A0A645CFN7_9ZZZZ